MDDHAFDDFSRAMARGIPRRQVLARLGTGGLGAALLGALGMDRARSARSALPAAQAATCRLDLVGAVRVGTNAEEDLGGEEPGELRGQLSFGLDGDGSITAGQLLLANDVRLPVVGQVVGRAVHLRVRNGEDSAIVLVGTAEQDLADCRGAVDGLLTGPAFGDLGDWHATATALQRQGGSSSGGGTGTRRATSEATSEATATAEPDDCPDEQERCGDECVDLQTDDANCGECGNECPQTEVCVEGACVDACEAEGLTSCDPDNVGSAVCADLQTDPLFCGSCETACEDDQACEDGACVDVDCPEGQVVCRGTGTCFDLQTDPNNCGECGVGCVSGVCEGGECTEEVPCVDVDHEVCDGRCTNLMVDPGHCGECGNACAEGELCEGGECTDAGQAGCDEGLTDCGGGCVDTDFDPNNCGACGNVCEGGVCDAGTCPPAGCGDGLTDCGGICVDTDTDPNNCGSCGNVCEGGVCDLGACAPTGVGIACAPGLTPCVGGQGANCCEEGQTCNDGACG